MTVSSALFTEAQLEALKAKFQQAGQGHVFTFFEQLDVKEQEALFQQLSELDVQRLNQIYTKAIQGAEAAAQNQAASLEPLSEQVFDSVLKASSSTLNDWETIGLTQIAQGKVAVILMAGGQGTRLGSSAPKGCYDINLPSKKTLFQLQAERILRLQTVAAKYATDPNSDIVIPWYIMTSGPTHQPTYDFFRANNFFGLKEENIIFFEQGKRGLSVDRKYISMMINGYLLGTLPCLTMDGKIILETKSKVAIAPDGNGGIYAAVQNKGVIDDLKKRGIQYSHCYCVDNCLARVADPVFIGYCVSKQTDCGVKVVGKAMPEEPVGVVCVRDGRYGVAEYSEISAEVTEMRNPDGSLMFGAANIANHFFSTEFLERVPTFAADLEYHIAKKKIKYTDLETGEQVVPKSNSGMKLECFVFDVFPYANRMSVLEVDRKDEFSPLKNAPGSGADCPETSRRDIVAQHVRFIEKAGGKLVGDNVDNFELLQFEISPLVSYGGEGLEDLIQGKTITVPAVIESVEELVRLAQ
ncbi:nucleotide-diphospho-sugar transferase [Radiomyces spectabilis]|uniref:nucleotide-diphospho-sugar transferase n=1 Tax=Radiomyces spectabilis TaxID=64574 RepID=UPI0022200643|nr:nucleotide-diphospho-sugar transferase [Radiomyces spectabilis]KAI8377415.1 nucleotide-diphospho-sugar transferase [Radiomyces spectabilis]